MFLQLLLVQWLPGQSSLWAVKAHTHVLCVSIYSSASWVHYNIHTFNGPLSGTTWISRYQKGKTDLDFTEARDSEWQWQQLGHMQVCTSLQTDNHASTPPLFFYRQDDLPAAQRTAAKHWRQQVESIINNYQFYCVDLIKLNRLNKFHIND